jgi:hypothetical protein
MAFAAAGACTWSTASAQALGKIESSHTSSSSSSSSSSSHHGHYGHHGSSDAGSAIWGCFVPPFLGLCVYGTRFLRADRSESAETLLPAAHAEGAERESDRSPDDEAETPRERPHAAPRFGELMTSGYVDPVHGVYGHDLTARGWLSIVGVDATWLRLYEPSSPTVGQLDFVRGAVTGIIVAERYVEASVHLGADGMHGSEWTPAFGAGAELRVYPVPHFTTAGSFHASFFGEGNPLLDSKLEVGATFGRLDFRIGGRSFYQTGAASLLGPSASLGIRLGP